MIMKKNLYYCIQVAVLALLFFHSYTFAASYQLKPMMLLYGKKNQAGNNSSNTKVLTISNNDSHTLYLSLSVKKILNPGLKNETIEEQLKSNPKAFGLMLNNNKLIIPPHQQRTVVVLSLNNSQKLKKNIVYQIITTPMQSEKFIAPKNTKVSGGVNFILQYAVRVFIQPNKINDTVKFKKFENHVRLTNTGNSFNSVSNLYNCPVAVSAEQVDFSYQNERYEDINKKLHCKKLNGASFIYPEQSLSYTIPKKNKLVLIMYDQGKHQAKVFKNTKV